MTETEKFFNLLEAGGYVPTENFLSTLEAVESGDKSPFEDLSSLNDLPLLISTEAETITRTRNFRISIKSKLETLMTEIQKALPNSIVSDPIAVAKHNQMSVLINKVRDFKTKLGIIQNLDGVARATASKAETRRKMQELIAGMRDLSPTEKFKALSELKHLNYIQNTNEQAIKAAKAADEKSAEVIKDLTDLNFINNLKADLEEILEAAMPLCAQTNIKLQDYYRDIESLLNNQYESINEIIETRRNEILAKLGIEKIEMTVNKNHEERLNLKDLNLAIEAANNVNRSEVSSDLLRQLDDALAMPHEGITQAEIDKKAQAITDALQAFSKSASFSTPSESTEAPSLPFTNSPENSFHSDAASVELDFSTLNKNIKELEQLKEKQGDYTPESWQAFMNEYMKVHELPETIQAEIDAKADALKSAMSLLQPKNINRDHSADSNEHNKLRSKPPIRGRVTNIEPGKKYTDKWFQFAWSRKSLNIMGILGLIATSFVTPPAMFLVAGSWLALSLLRKKTFWNKLHAFGANAVYTAGDTINSDLLKRKAENAFQRIHERMIRNVESAIEKNKSNYEILTALKQAEDVLGVIDSNLAEGFRPGFWRHRGEFPSKGNNRSGGMYR